MWSAHVGEVAALLTAFCWVLSALFFARAGERVGSLSVNFIRLLVAFFLLGLVTLVTRGSFLPLDATQHQWVWLSVSGLVGFTFGDLCLFRALIDIGPRLSTLLMSLAPPITAAFGALLLGERLTGRAWVAMALIVFGVVLAVLSRENQQDQGSAMNYRRGIALGVLGAVGQAGGLVLSKHGMGHFDAVASTHIRVIAGMLGFTVIFAIIGWWPKVWKAATDATAMKHISIGAVAGPFIGVSLSLYAVQHTETGIAASLMGTTPVLIIPFAVIVNKEKVGWQGVLGAVIAVVGCTLLFL